MRKIKTVSIGSVYNGEYSALKNTCFVNELDTDLTFKGDIAQGVIKNNGENIQCECKELTKNSNLSVGSVFITHEPHPIIHAVVCSEGEISDFLDLCDATRNSLLLAETNCIKSVTFPSLSIFIALLSSPPISIIVLISLLIKLAPLA